MGQNYMLLTYLKYHLLKHISVKEAVTEKEKNRIYEFRYRVYHEENKMIEKNYDHQQKTLKDALDDKNNSILSYTTIKNNIASTCRTHYLDRNLVSEEDSLKYFLDELPLDSNQCIAFTERLAIEKGMRGKYLIASQAIHMSTRLCRDFGSYFSFSSCSPGLLRHYMQLGYRPYSTELIQFNDRVEIPIVVMPDMQFLRNMKSIIYPPLNKYCSKSLKSNYENFRPDVLENYITFNKTIDDIDSTAFLKHKKSFLYHLKKETINYVIKNCYFLNLRKGALLFSEKEHHQERYIVLLGELVISKAGTTIMNIHPGDIVGEFGTFHDNYLRHVSVTALEDCRLMVIPRSFERKLFKFDSLLYINFIESYIKSISNTEKKLIIKFLSDSRSRHVENLNFC